MSTTGSRRLIHLVGVFMADHHVDTSVQEGPDFLPTQVPATGFELAFHGAQRGPATTEPAHFSTRPEKLEGARQHDRGAGEHYENYADRIDAGEDAQFHCGEDFQNRSRDECKDISVTNKVKTVDAKGRSFVRVGNTH